MTRFYKTIVYTIVLLGLASPILTAQAEAVIVNTAAEGHLRYESDSLGNFIADFSYAGYQNGEEAIPTVPTVLTIEPVAGDNTAHIQAAIDEVASRPLDANGLRGAVELAAGRYPVAGRLRIGASGVVLRGVGQGADASANTVIIGEGNAPAARNLITVGGAPFVSWNSEMPGSRSDIITEVVPAGGRTIKVANPDLYAVGDNIIVYHPSTNAWLASINFGDTDSDAPWTAGTIDMVFNRYIEAIDQQTGQITLDVPVYDRLDRSLAQSYIYLLNEPDIINNAGIENLRIEVASSGELNEDHVRTTIFLEGVEDAWVSDVTALRFSYAAVDMEVATRVTVQRCSGLTPHSPITGGRRYNFATNSQSNNILFTECRGSNGRHTFVSNSTSSGSGIVFHNSTSTGDLSASEGHRRWSQGLLFDNIVFTESQTFTLLGLYNRGSFGTGHGWSATNSVAWNVSVPFPRFILLQRPPGRQNFAVGCKALITGEGTFVFPVGYSELTNQQPAIGSIYETQLATRMEFGALPDPPASVQAFNDGDRISVNWEDASSEENGYEVFVSTDGGATFSSVATVSSNTTSYEHVVTHADPTQVRYRVASQRSNMLSPASAHAPITLRPADPGALFVTYFDDGNLDEINTSNSAGAVTTFGLDDECETLTLAVTDPVGMPLGSFSPYVIRVNDAEGNAITDISDRVNFSMRVRSIAPVTISAQFRSGEGGNDERSDRLSFDVPGDTTQWTEFTLDFGADDLDGFNPADLRDCWFFLDRGTDNFNGNEVVIDYIAIAGEADPEEFSECQLGDGGSEGPVFAELFRSDDAETINRNSAAGQVSTFTLNADCETMAISVTDPVAMPLPAFNAYQVRATDEEGNAISDITDRVSVNVRVRSAATVAMEFQFRSGLGGTNERSARKAVTLPGGLDNWTDITLEWEASEFEGFSPTDLRDLWFFLDRGDENFNGNNIIFDHIVIGGVAAEMDFSPCPLGGSTGEAFFEYFAADSLSGTGLNLAGSAAAASTFTLDTECETLSISVTDTSANPLGGFSPYQLRAVDMDMEPITDITGGVSVNFRVRSAGEVVLDFLFRSGDGSAEMRSARKSVVVPGDLMAWSTFTLTWEADELEGFNPAELLDLWFFLDRGEENFNGNEVVFDHIVIGATAEAERFSPCPLIEVTPTAFFEYFQADTITNTSLNLNSMGALLTDFNLDTDCETLRISVSDPLAGPLPAFTPYQLRATDVDGEPITSIEGLVSVNFRARSAEPVVVDFLFRSGAGAVDERSDRKQVTVPGNLGEWSEFTLTWTADDLAGFDPTDLRDLWFYLDRGTDNFAGNEIYFDHIVIGATGEEDSFSSCILTSTEEVLPLASVSVYPNPTENFLWIKAEDQLRIDRWSLFDLQGRMLATGNNTAEAIPMGGYSSGMYVLRMETAAGQMIQRRVIKQ